MSTPPWSASCARDPRSEPRWACRDVTLIVSKTKPRPGLSEGVGSASPWERPSGPGLAASPILTVEKPLKEETALAIGTRSIERLLKRSQSTKTARGLSPRHCREAFARLWE
eukprot:10200049-Alexandrium_andersonii.AAC.1